MSTHLHWLSRTIGKDSRRIAAERSGIPASTLNLQFRKGSLSSETVIKLARAYGQSPVLALAETGFLTAQEVVPGGQRDCLQLASDMELLSEVARRIAHSPGAWDMPLDEALSLPEQDPDHFERSSEDDTEP